MDPNRLRVTILRYLAEHEATGTGALCSDEQLVAATGAEKADVHRQLGVLENEGLVRLRSGRFDGPSVGIPLGDATPFEQRIPEKTGPYVHGIWTSKAADLSFILVGVSTILPVINFAMICRVQPT